MYNSLLVVISKQERNLPTSYLHRETSKRGRGEDLYIPPCEWWMKNGHECMYEIANILICPERQEWLYGINEWCFYIALHLPYMGVILGFSVMNQPFPRQPCV